MKEMNVLIKEAKKQGWEVKQTNGSHYKWVSPIGKFFFTSLTPSDHRALKNIERDLRVNGFITLTRKKGRR